MFLEEVKNGAPTVVGVKQTQKALVKETARGVIHRGDGCQRSHHRPRQGLVRDSSGSCGNGPDHAGIGQGLWDPRGSSRGGCS